MWPNEEAGAGLPGAVRGKRTRGTRGGRGDPEGGSELGSSPGPAAFHNPAAGSSMKCLVTGSNVKGELGPARGWGHMGGPKAPAKQCFSPLLPAVLGKAVHSLSRIGDELYLEPLEDGVRSHGIGGG